MEDSEKKYKIRVAKIEDSTQLEQLIIQLGYFASAESVATRILEIGKDQNQIIYVSIEIGGEIIGWVHALKVRYLESEPFVEIGGLVVDINHRGKGIGKALMQAVERWAISQKLHEIRLRSNIIRSEAHIFYQKIGYQNIKTQYTFYKKLE
jgi:GNAT superfamily N-acetyltransferase